MKAFRILRLTRILTLLKRFWRLWQCTFDAVWGARAVSRWRSCHAHLIDPCGGEAVVTAQIIKQRLNILFEGNIK